MNNDLLYIRLAVREPALWEQLAEEAAELAQAALKVARAKRGENPTPVSIDDATGKAIEEFTDVILCSRVLQLFTDRKLYSEKLSRWIKRLEESNVYQ